MHILFLCKKIEQAVNPALSTMYCYLSVLTLLFSDIGCCCCFCCKIKFFSFSAINCSTKFRIKSLLFKTIVPLSALQKGLAFLLRPVATILLYFSNKFIQFSKKYKKMFSLLVEKYSISIAIFPYICYTVNHKVMWE